MVVPVAAPYRIYLTVLHGIAIISTSFRLIHRHCLCRLWWDDFWALLALFFDTVYFATLWIPIDLKDPGALLRFRARTITYYVMALLFTCALWAARLSVITSIIRILPPRNNTRHVATGVAMFFGLAWIALLIQKVWVCVDGRWRPGVPCPIAPAVGIAQLSTDIVADVVLIGIPICMLWRTKLPSNQRILILSIFATSIVITVFSIVHNINILKDAKKLLVITAHLEAAVGTIVCNLLVIVTCVYRLMRNGRELEGTTSERAVSEHPPLTTVVDTSAATLTLTGTDSPSRIAFAPDTQMTNSSSNASNMHTLCTNTNRSSVHVEPEPRPAVGGDSA